MPTDSPDDLATFLQSIDGVTYAEAHSNSETDDWYIEFEVEQDTAHSEMEGLSHKMLRFLTTNEFRVEHDMVANVWEAWPRELDDHDALMRAFGRLGTVLDEAADKRRTVNRESVDKTITTFRDLASREMEFTDPSVDDILDDLESIAAIAESHSRRVDHTRVRELMDDIEREAAENGYL